MSAEREIAQDPISERAAQFWERRRFGSWTESDQAELDTWLEQSTVHRVAYLRVEAIAARTDTLAAVHDFRPFARPVRAARARRRPFPAWGWAVPVLSAASLAAFVVFGLPLVNAWLAPAARSLSTDLGGRTLVSFADGSEFQLNTDTAIRYQMTNRERTVWLDRGEAWFHIAHDARHPFSVIVGNHRVTDLGTEFDVRREAVGLEVALLSGSAVLGTGGVQTIALLPGDDAVATAVSVKVSRQTPQALADKLAWRNGELVFRSTRMADAVAELNRYNTTKLVIADPSIADERISTNLKTNELEKFVALTQGVLNLHVERTGNQIVFSRERHRQTQRARN